MRQLLTCYFLVSPIYFILFSLEAFATDLWQYGGFVDVAYPLNFNYPENHQWRSKQTTPRTNESTPNMGLVYLRKDPAEESRWGVELALQAGYDTNDLVPDPQPGGAQPIDGADTLRHLARANVSYLAPVGRGLTLTAGLFKGFKAYEEFYAKYNLNYTRTYLTDYNPNFFMGVGASYALTKSFELGFFVVNEYQYLSHANDLPSYAAKMEWRAAPHITFYQNLYYGPDQQASSIKFWRAFSDSTVEWRVPDWRVALSYDVGTEEIADRRGTRGRCYDGRCPLHPMAPRGPMERRDSTEFYWDPQGRMTQNEQLLWANTTTLEYKKHIGQQLAIVRLEYRYDHTGAQGGFFHNGSSADGMPKLVSGQHLMILGLILAFDSA